MIDLLKKFYHRFSNYAFIRWLGRVYLHGFFISNFIAYWRLRKLVLQKQKEEKKDQIHVVFLAQNRQAWEKSEAIYQAMKEDQKFHVDIVVIPDITDEDEMETYQYFKEIYPEAIRAGKQGKLCNLRELKPDYVFYTRPFDQYLPVEYRSGRVARYAKLCYCPYGTAVLDGGRTESMPRLFSRNIYLLFAENECTKNDNRKRFPFSNKKYRKSLFLGYPSYDRLRDSSFTQFSPVFLWTPRWTTDQHLGGSTFFEYKDKLPDYFKEQEDKQLICRPHPLTFYHFQSTGQMSAEEVKEYILKYQQSKRIRMDDSSDYLQSFQEAGVLITDISSMIFEWYVTAKPIIFCDIGLKFKLEVTNRALEGCYAVHNWEELKENINMLSAGIDPLKEKRKQISKELCGDGNSCAGQNIANYVKEDYYTS